MKQKNLLSQSLEDYLETIFLLSEKNKKVRVTDIATQLRLSKPSVNRAIVSLHEQGYIEHEHYGSIILTELGRKTGETIYDTHQLLKRFLMDYLNVSESIAEYEACSIEHIISKSTRKKLKKYMKKNDKLK